MDLEIEERTALGAGARRNDMTSTWIQLCAYYADGTGIDDIPEYLMEYQTLAERVADASKVPLAPEFVAWVRAVAAVNEKPENVVWGLWLAHTKADEDTAQSPTQSEFLAWRKMKSPASGVLEPATVPGPQPSSPTPEETPADGIDGSEPIPTVEVAGPVEPSQSGSPAVQAELF